MIANKGSKRQNQYSTSFGRSINIAIQCISIINQSNIHCKIYLSFLFVFILKTFPGWPVKATHKFGLDHPWDSELYTNILL